MEIVNIYKAGSIVIPGALLKKLNDSSKLLIADVKNDLFIIKNKYGRTGGTARERF